ncbi:type VI secretion protein IcmF/TssM N-terminal domain-containing protein [Variovorax sp. KK3]|uniref:type VI secretion protein IcmF/TssM N-terminal domain-containing protein n=1 Tax=Variovorax sp. KK3 TaxID=1855728 RepID=UPI00097C8D4F|nr:type VI secretion protein IcmF/TssM N-terminal domain-containing protein [Variovorax sp. KK3]
MNAPHPLPTHYGILLGICLAGLLALWWFMLGSRHIPRLRLLQRRIEALGLSANAEDQAAFIATRAAAQHAREALLRAAPLRGLHQPLYDLPWVLLIGHEDAGLPALLTAARNGDAGAAASTDTTAFWRWHLLPAMVAIETLPAALREPATPLQRGLWLHAMLALADQRERLPLNGIAVCIGAASLLGDGSQLLADAQRLRRRVDEVVAFLRLQQLPVYLLVTGLERLPGYAALRSALPDAVLAQALGHRVPHGDSASTRPDVIFEPLVQRLHALRMSLLRQHAGSARREAIHAFIEQVRALQPGLRHAVEQLFGPGSNQGHARWRGLYLVAAPADTAEAAFVADLFQRFLPADQPLAR